MPDPDDPARIERRDAMRAALAGASLAALSEPPRILSLTVAPDVAQAATRPCTPGSDTILHPILQPSRECWGSIAPNGTCVDLVVGPHLRGSFTLQATIGGADVRNGGHATVNVAGPLPPATCSARLTATCLPPVQPVPLPESVRSPAHGTPIELTITEPGLHVLGPWSCTGRWPESVTLTISCRC